VTGYYGEMNIISKIVILSRFDGKFKIQDSIQWRLLVLQNVFSFACYVHVS